jgi:hypothetical protein
MFRQDAGCGLLFYTIYERIAYEMFAIWGTTAVDPVVYNRYICHLFDLSMQYVDVHPRSACI